MKTLVKCSAAAFLCAALATHARAAERMIRLDPAKLPSTGKIDQRFQSYNIEMAGIIGGKFWKPYAHGAKRPHAKDAPIIGENADLFEKRPPLDLYNHRLLTLARALGPAYLRVSGTWANTVYFQNDDNPPMAAPPVGFRGVLTRREWRSVVDFARAVDAKLVTSFTISLGVRTPSGSWTDVEAKPLVEFTRAIGGDIYAAEFFNEPNVPSFGGAPKGYDAAQFSLDESRFRTFVEKYAPEMKIVGPGGAVTGNLKLPGIPVEQLLRTDPKPIFDIFSYHFYGALSQRCAPANSPAGTSAENALTESWLGGTAEAFEQQKQLRDRFAPAAPIWNTETAGAACGGTPWDATFLDTFRYVDQLARLAKLGAAAVFHNTLVGSDYGLIDEDTMEPRPSYWAAVLWRRLMGTTVLDTGNAPAGLNVYAQCLRGVPGGVSVLAINLSKAWAQIDGVGPADVYALTAQKLEAEAVDLNGHRLALGRHDVLPPLRPVRWSSVRLTLRPTSINFIAVPKAHNPNCL